MDPPTLAGNLGLPLRHGHQRCALESNVGRTVAVEIVHRIEIALHHLHPVEIDSIVLLLNLWLIFRGCLRRRIRLLAEERCCSWSTSLKPPNRGSKRYNTQNLPIAIHSTVSLQNFATIPASRPNILILPRIFCVCDAKERTKGVRMAKAGR